MTDRVPEGPNERGWWPLVFRGGPDVTIDYDLFLQPNVPSTTVAVTLTFRGGTGPAGFRGEGLWPGTISWPDRRLRENESSVVRVTGFEKAQITLRRTGEFTTAVTNLNTYDGEFYETPTDFDRLLAYPQAVYFIYANPAESPWHVTPTDLIELIGASPPPSHTSGIFQQAHPHIAP